MKPSVTRTFLRGLFTFLPAALTLYLLYLMVVWAETLAMALIRPIVGDFYLPGLGIAIVAALIYGLGVLVARREFSRVLSFMELPFTNLPVIKSIYTSLKNFADYFAPADKGAPQQQVVLLRMPGNELSIVGLVTRQNFAGLPGALGELDQVAVYLPMGYMIGGYTVFVPRTWITPIPMSVEEAMRSSLIAWMASSRDNVRDPARTGAEAEAEAKGPGPLL
jgi:uncharacterized membrane protein